MKRAIGFLLLLFTGAAIAAEPSIAPAMNGQVADVFSSSTGTDFGQRIIEYIVGGGNSNYGEVSLLSTISRFLNLGALSLMAWLAVVGATTFVIQTGNKGVPGGQVISSFWMPIRITAAVILLIPLTSGYSTLQYGVITVAEKSNSFANYVMGKGLDYLYQNGAYRSPALADGSAVVMSWVASEVCRQYINGVTNFETIQGVTTQRPSPQGGGSVTEYSYNHTEPGESSQKSDPRIGYCGKITFTILSPKSSEHAGTLTSLFSGPSDPYSSAHTAPAAIAAKHQEIIAATLPKVQAVAKIILHDESALLALQSGGESQQSTYEKARAEAEKKTPEALRLYYEAVAAYNAKTQGIIATAVNDIITKKNDGASWVEQTKEAGWPALGTIFWQQMMSQSQINQLAKAFTAEHTPPQLDDAFRNDERLRVLSARISGLQKAKRLGGGNTGSSNGTANIDIDSYSLSAIEDAGSEGKGIMDGIKNIMYEAFAASFRAMAFRNGDDPIINLQYFGNATGAIAETIFWAKTIGSSVAVGILTGTAETAKGAKNSADNFAFGFGSLLGAPGSVAVGAVEGIKAGVQSFIDQVGPFFNMIILYLLIIGLTLGVILPTIPVVQWFMGFLSWLLFFIECLLVSPMWLAAHGTAEKEGWGTEHTRQGYMLMIGLLLGPLLRVVGFFTILLLMRPIGVLMSWLIDYINGVLVSGFINPFVIAGAMAVVTIFAYTAMVRMFSLPSELFERGLRWVNGGQEVTGDSGAERETRTNVAAFGHKSEAAGHRMQNPGGQAAQGFSPTGMKPKHV
jgi:conjugal transfer/type IV secretion protein DotA/TraY